MEFLNGVNALTLVFTALLMFAIAYRYYGIFLANKVLWLNAKNVGRAVSSAVTGGGDALYLAGWIDHVQGGS